MKLSEDLLKRGLIKQVTSEKVLDLLDNEKITFYCGFDPTADSLHVGSLLPLITMLRLKKAGHTPLVVLGGATASIGDPSGKSQERKILGKEQIEENLISIKKQVCNVLGENTSLLNNADWFKNISFIDFLRNVGKNFTVNSMLTKDSVRSRLEDRDQGISFTEFSYMLLQAEDFRHLFETKNCVLECGGSDQWSHILSGIELIRKTTAKEAFGLTFPLVVKSDGMKFGKTEKGNVWLDPVKTSPFDFFQFFMNVADADVPVFLNFFSQKSLFEIDSLVQATKVTPELRLGQKALAQELTTLVHGEDALKKVEEQISALFASKDASLAEPTVEVSLEDVENVRLVEWLVKLGLSSSKGMAKKDIQGGGIRLNQEKVLDADKVLTQEDLKNNRVLVSKGKSQHKVIAVKGG